MSAFLSTAPMGSDALLGARAGASHGTLRFGRESMSSGGAVVQWLLKRNCSFAPRQLLAFYASFCLLSLAIAGLFWLRGALLVMPFAGIELLCVGAALLAYARHAADREIIRLLPGCLTVRRVNGPCVEQVDFAPAWVRVEPETSDRSLIELSGQGRRIAVGRFVRPELRRAFADELRWALRRVPARAAPVGVVAEEESELKWQP
jgi:uncharacterized membrane protein